MHLLRDGQRKGYSTQEAVTRRRPSGTASRLLFQGAKDGPKATILVAKETIPKMVLATMVPMKGASIEFPVKRCLGFLKEIGLENADLVLKSDQEPSIMDVLNNVAKRRSASSKLELLEGVSEFLGSGSKSADPKESTGRPGS